MKFLADMGISPRVFEYCCDPHDPSGEHDDDPRGTRASWTVNHIG